VLTKDVQHPWADLGKVNSVDVGGLERLRVDANVNVGGVMRVLLIAGTDLVVIGKIGVGSYTAETKNKICQRSTKALGESHVGAGVGFIDSGLFRGMELVCNLGDWGGDLVETRCIDSGYMTENSRFSAAQPTPEREVSNRGLRSVDAHVMVGAINSSRCFPPVDNRLVAKGVSGGQRLNNSGPESLERHVAVGLGNKCRGKAGRQNNDSARSDTLAGGVVGNGQNVVNTSS